MRRLLLIAFALLGLLASPVAAKAPDVEVALSPADGGDWIAEFRFRKAAPAWMFFRSAMAETNGKPWRPQSWTVLTPGVRIERRGWHDVLAGDGRPLTRVKIRVKPWIDGLQADYAPVLKFSDGGIAHYNGQYAVGPLKNAAQADAFPRDTNGLPLDPVTTRFVVKSPESLLLEGRVSRGRAETALNPDRYVYFGAAPLIETESVAAVIDPGLPGWMGESLNRFTPALLAEHERRLGPRAGPKPTVYVAWGGADRKGYSYNGGTLPGLIVMSIRGQDAVEPFPALERMMRWFIGHEAAHFWLGQTVRYSDSSEAWMLEGGADVLTVRALRALDPTYDPKTVLQEAVDDCLKLARPGEALGKAPERGEHRASYACGAVLLLAAEAGLRKTDPTADAATFWRPLIEANRAEGVVDTDAWFAAFGRATGDAALTERARRWATDGDSDPSGLIGALLADVPHRAENGRLVLL